MESDLFQRSHENLNPNLIQQSVNNDFNKSDADIIGYTADGKVLYAKRKAKLKSNSKWKSQKETWRADLWF